MLLDGETDHVGSPTYL